MPERDQSGNSYRGVLGAFPYALRASSSTVFRIYTLLAALATLFVTLIIAFGLVTLIAATASVAGGSLTLSRAFYAVVGILIVGPLLAPVLLVARRHRRNRQVATHYDSLLGVSGGFFLLSLYTGLVITVPPAQQQPVSGVLEGVITTLYEWPPLAGVVPPALASGVIWVVHRQLG